jgi:CSLREA domain-containing protein
MKQRSAFIKAAFYLALIILFSNVTRESSAATFNVNSTLDRQDRDNGDGSCETATARQCTLRAAITEANASPGGDIITLPAGTYQITLTTAGEDNNTGGDFDINSGITFNGAGAGSTFIQAAASAGSATERVFHFLSGTSIINGVTIRFGGGLSGAGILVNSSANVTLNSATVSDNISLRTGGGIFSGGILTVNNSLITNNSTGENFDENSFIGGAGILSQGNTTLNNTTVSLNRARTAISSGTTPQIHGGGIWGFSGTLDINNSSINGNEASMTSTQITNAFGGGVSVGGAFVTINDSSVTNNIVNANNFRSGGGISVTLRRLTLNRTLVSGNDGKGIDMTFYPGFSGNYESYINQSAIINNLGGGVSIGEGSVHAEVNNSTIAKNSGVGIFNGNTVNTLNVNFSTIARNSVGVSGRANLKNSIVADNTGASGTNPDISGIITSQGYNHVENVGNAAFTPTTGDVTGTDPMLGELIGSGSNSVFIPAINSPVIDTIPNGTNECGVAPFNEDQRKISRPTDSNGDAAAACEKGAVETISPTAASVPVSGRVLAGKQTGVVGAIVYLTDSAGRTRSARTNSFGYYRFEEVLVGETYLFNVFSKRYQFSPRIITVIEETTELNFRTEN